MLAAATVLTMNKNTGCRRFSKVARLVISSTVSRQFVSCYNCSGKKPCMRQRLAVSAAIGLGSGTYCWFLMCRLHEGAGDFGWTLRLAQRLLAGQNPYDTRYEQYPLSAAFFALPFVRLQPEVAAGFFWGISSFLLAFGLTRHGYHRLLIFLAYPYWAGIIFAQWSPIIAAAALFPLLLPVTMAKPPRELLWPVLISWGAGIWRRYQFPHSFNQVGRWAVIFLYLPMLAVVLLRKRVPYDPEEPAKSSDYAANSGVE